VRSTISRAMTVCSSACSAYSGCQWKAAKVLHPLAQRPLTHRQAQVAEGLLGVHDGVTPEQSVPEGPESVSSRSLRLLARSNFPSNNVTDALRYNPDVLRKAIFREARRLQEFFFEHLAGRDRRHCTDGLTPSVMVDNLDFGGTIRRR
jgi:hypothetical protein